MLLDADVEGVGEREGAACTQQEARESKKHCRCCGCMRASVPHGRRGGVREWTGVAGLGKNGSTEPIEKFPAFCGFLPP